MKKLLLFVMATFPLALSAQVLLPEDYKKRAESNLEYLIKDETLRQYVKLDESGVQMFDPRSGEKAEVKIYWDEVDFFLRLMQKAEYSEMLDLYLRKGQNHFPASILEKYQWMISKPKPSILGLKVAIDPGHFAGSFKEAVQESKYVIMHGKDLGLEEEKIQFYEAELAYETSMLLKRMLEEKGAQVFLSHEKGVSAVGKPFDHWYKEDFINDLNNAVAEEDFTIAQAEAMKNAGPVAAFYRLYKFLDFRGRAERINSTKPDVTVVVHFNALEGGERRSDLSLAPHNENYSMAFVPGAFVRGELNKLDARIDFLRLLLSEDLEGSVYLSSSLMQDHMTSLGIPPVSEAKGLNWQKDYAIYSGEPGVFHRNLYLTRAIKSPIIYGESLLQDNAEEAKQLYKKDVELYGIKTSRRVLQVAQSYFQALLDYYGVEGESFGSTK